MKPLLDMVEAVLFDLDGTLVETNIDFPLMKREMIALAAEYGACESDLYGLDILAVIDTTAGAMEARGELKGAAALRSRAMRILEEIELRHADTTQDIPFSREAVAALKERGIRVGIVTRNCRRASEISLSLAKIEPDVMMCREDTRNHKPHPEPLLAALSALDARPEASVMVGDHIMDVQGGKAVGMKTIGFLRESRPDDFFNEVAPDYIARDLKEVLHAIIDLDS